MSEVSSEAQRGDALQSVIAGDLFSDVQMSAGVRQVLEFLEPHAVPLSEAQMRSIAYLNYLGMRNLHREYRESHTQGRKVRHPYTDFIAWIIESSRYAAHPNVFIRAIEALIPAPVRAPAEPAKREKRRS